MDWHLIEASWSTVKGKIKDKWGKLTDDDLSAINGRRDRLEDRILQRYGFATDYVREEVDGWVRWQVLTHLPQTQRSALNPRQASAHLKQRVQLLRTSEL
jgi:uncharacterized protein YjbJ (UPF0337 family)